MTPDRSFLKDPPGVWSPFHRLAKKTLAPVERFLAVETSSGLILFFMALLALLLANSPWQQGFASFWHTPLGIRIGNWSFERDLHFWINDGLMTIFFFLVGLEIKREIYSGELSQLRRATLPLMAALGGMALPAMLFLVMNFDRPPSVGWGIPMATDIAFAVGVLALLGRRVSPAVRILLLTLAVIDDVGAIIVIATSYSTGIESDGLVLVAVGMFTILTMQKLGVRSPWTYVFPAIVIWAGTYAAGIHPTLSGVIVGLMTPAQAWFSADMYLQMAERKVQSMKLKTINDKRLHLPELSSLKQANREAVSPVERVHHALHGWSAFAIMPVFALANAGISLQGINFDADGITLFLGIIVGLVVGKPLGIVIAAKLACRSGFASLPEGVSWAEVGVVGFCAGIGYTMALFIAQLAFSGSPFLPIAKLGILCASVIAGLLAFSIGRKVLVKPSHVLHEMGNN